MRPTRKGKDGVYLEACAIAGLVVALLPIAWPFLHDGFPYAHDSAHHLAYAYRFDRALHQGQFPVRWAEPLLPGRGQPVFNYYQVGFYYIVSVIHEIVSGIVAAIKSATVVLWWSGAAFMFMLCRRFGTFAAVAAADAFVLSPYLITAVFGSSGSLVSGANVGARFAVLTRLRVH